MAADDILGGDRLMTTAEVAGTFRVDPGTVTRWIRAGKLTTVRMPGSHHRVRESEVRQLIEKGGHDGHAHQDDH